MAATLTSLELASAQIQQSKGTLLPLRGSIEVSHRTATPLLRLASSNRDSSWARESSPTSSLSGRPISSSGCRLLEGH